MNENFEDDNSITDSENKYGSKLKKESQMEMNLWLWIPAMFLIGIALMGLCYLFMEACEKI
jgi:hypothetical protein